MVLATAAHILNAEDEQLPVQIRCWWSEVRLSPTELSTRALTEVDGCGQT